MARKDRPKPKTREEAIALRNKKRKSRRNNILIAVLLLGAFIWYGLQPITATTQYGICKTFVETRVRYPTTLQLTEYDIYGNSTRIFYTYQDASGSTRSDMTECLIVPHPQIGYMAQTISINRQDISAEELRRFNLSIPGILAAEPNLRVPEKPKQGNLFALQPRKPTFLQQ